MGPSIRCPFTPPTPLSGQLTATAPSPTTRTEVDTAAPGRAYASAEFEENLPLLICSRLFGLFTSDFSRTPGLPVTWRGQAPSTQLPLRRTKRSRPLYISTQRSPAPTLHLWFCACGPRVVYASPWLPGKRHDGCSDHHSSAYFR